MPPHVVLERVALALVGVHALAGGGVDGERVAEFGDALQGGGLGGVVSAPAVVLAFEPTRCLAGQSGFAREPVDAAGRSRPAGPRCR